MKDLPKPRAVVYKDGCDSCIRIVAAEDFKVTAPISLGCSDGLLNMPGGGSGEIAVLFFSDWYDAMGGAMVLCDLPGLREFKFESISIIISPEQTINGGRISSYLTSGPVH